ncbi:acyltransferase family protein [Paraglaciecola sp. L3A3]|uniref:acyltransferase family protein n=1 Tax=Paraglaciecola sp. L3A3 TaxID=2686358 RepID=UPI00131E89C0|nr:acyltransferase family protein [Paraglaciecola sp. L3A3]
MSNLIKYRNDLDGLRAIAILPVILFHQGYNFVSGGYVGVDIFFVLSGYLISLIIIKEIKENSFKFSNFFLRRIRRLLPMALTIYTFCLFVFLFIYPNIYFQKILNAILASSFFSSNILFWQQGGYFTSHVLELNPLLHTWSLSVEEQFYFLFPIFLLLLFKITSSIKLQLLLIIALILCSISLAIIYAPSDVSYAAFYLLPPRLYELGVGSLLAFIIYQFPDHSLRKLKYLKELGLVLILYSVFMFDENTSFPSYNALVPVLGAGLIIFSNRNIGFANWILNQKQIVFIGLISYSLYLWHWPLIVIQNWIFSTETAFFVPILTLLISFIFSILTYRYIETPTRNKNLFSNKKLLQIIFSLFSLLLITTLLLKYVGNNYIVDRDGSINHQFIAAIEPEPNRASCTNKMKQQGELEYCEMSSKSPTNKKIFVWGDSHGSALMPAFDNFNNSYDIKYSNNTGCPPIQNVERNNGRTNCKGYNDKIIQHLLDSDYNLVIIVGAFNNYLNWGLINTLEDTKSDDSLTERLKRNINNLHSRFEEKSIKFLFISQPPRFTKSVPLEYLRVKTLGLDYEQQTISLAEYNHQTSDFFSIIPTKWQKLVFRPIQLYCPKNTCISQKDNHLLYKDSHHITNDFAKEVGVELEIFLSNILDSQRDEHEN